ncbi:MAG TPA: hypothetical protein VED43_03260 [Mycobacterium sp.]|nr:hypothetical protein [Mycobacterium sp.]
MVEQKVDAYGATIFSEAGGVLTRRPQDAYARMRAAAPAMTEVFRHPEIDSSQMPAGHFGAARPLIPIELDHPTSASSARPSIRCSHPCASNCGPHFGCGTAASRTTASSRASSSITPSGSARWARSEMVLGESV